MGALLGSFGAQVAGSFVTGQPALLGDVGIPGVIGLAVGVIAGGLQSRNQSENMSAGMVLGGCVSMLAGAAMIPGPTQALTLGLVGLGLVGHVVARSLQSDET